MKILKNYNEFLNEALTLKQYREHAYNKKGKSRFKRKRYAELFQKMKEKYDGDRNAYRIYLPLIVEKRENPTEDEITKFLAENGYVVLDYFRGACKFKDAKNPAKIGQILTRLKATELMKKFVEDPERKKGNADELMVCISRHPYDIIGSDTDRNWTDCMTLALDEDHPRIKNLEKAVEKMRKKLSDYEEEYNNLDEDEDGDIDKINELDDKMQNLRDEIEEMEQQIADYTEEGENAIYWRHEVKEGSLVAYLIKKDDKNINDPLAVLNIKPYINDEGKIYVNACRESYGVYNEDFHNTVETWLKEANEGKTGIFKLNPKVYCDSDFPTVYAGDRTMNQFFDEEFGDQNIKNLDPNTWSHLNNKHITSLEGIEKINNVVTILNLGQNKLTDIKELSGFTHLESLYLHQNKITSIDPILKLENLKQLYAGNNKLTSINIENLPNLVVLNIPSNKITEINLKNAKKLEALYCDQNLLTSIDVSGLKNLTSLSLYNNKITKIEGLEKLEKLQGLGYASNPLKYPIPAKILLKVAGTQYTPDTIKYFKTYEFQKEFLDSCVDNPKKVMDLLCLINQPKANRNVNSFGFDEKIKEEYKKLLKEGIEHISNLMKKVNPDFPLDILKFKNI